MAEKLIKQIYVEYRMRFIAYMSQWSDCSKEELEDLYQETFIAFCENIKARKYQPQNDASIQTYLFQIGKFKLYNRQRDQKVFTEPIEEKSLLIVEDTDDYQVKSEEITYEFIQSIDPACRKILTLYYWDRLRMDEIAQRLDLKNEQVAKNKKSICLRKIKSALKQRLAENGIER